MKIVWLAEAIDDLPALRDYIDQDNSMAAARVVNKIFHSIEILSDQPGAGKQGRVVNTRELVAANIPYIVPYRVKSETIQILRVLHTARQWPAKI
jgi:toxin ParE1/3/4